MPIYKFTSPQGEDYEVHGPDGSTREQAFSILQEGIKSGYYKPITKQNKQQESSFGDELGVALKQGFVAPGNLVDRAVSGLAGAAANLFGATEDRDKIFKELNERVASRNQWANPNNVDPGITANVVGTVANLPAQLLTMPAQVFETGQQMIDRGESLPKAQLGQAITGGLNAVGLAAGPMGKSLVSKIVTGAGANAAQTAVQKKLLESISETEAGKKANELTAKDLIVSGVLGAAAGGLSYKGKPKTTPKPSGGDIVKTALGQKAQETSLDLAVEGDLFRRQAQQTELPFSTGVEEIAQRQRDAYNPNQLDMFMENQGGQRQPYPADSVLTDAQSVEQLRKLNEQGHQLAITEDFGNNDPVSHMPNMRVDENGIPIRADLSMEAQNLENPLQRNLWGDELPIETGDGGVPLTQALDSMPPGLERTQAIEQLSGTKAPTLRKSGRFGQQGGVDPDLLTLGIPALAKRLHDWVGKKMEDGIDVPKTSIDYLNKMGVYDSKLYPGQPAEESIAATHKAIEQAEAQGRSSDSNLWKSTQAGLVLAGEKIKATAPWVQNAGRWMAWAQHITDYSHKQFIQPLEKTLTNLSRENLVQFNEIMREMQLNRTALTSEELLKAGADPRVVKAIEHFRAEDARSLEAVNASRRALSKREITADEAHYHSQFQGDFQVFVRDKTGKMLWPVHTKTKAEANKAAAWLRNYFKDNDDVDTKQITVQFKPGKAGKNFDMLATLKDFETMFPEGSPQAALVQEAMQKYLDARGNEIAGQNLVQEKGKANMRGFEGDKPWLDPHKDAREAVKSSMQNMLDQHKWAALQQMMAEVKKMLTDPVIQEKQPNNVALVKNYLLHNMGITDNMFRGVQQALADTWVGEKTHLSSNSIPKAIRDLKAFGYAITLSGSLPYAIATPLQAIAGTAGNIVRSVGLGEIRPQDVPMAIGSVLNGIYSGLTGAKPFTTWSRDAMQYAKDNGIATNVLFDEFQNIGRNRGAQKLDTIVNFTISRPDQVCRLPVFMAFADMLEKSGKFATKEQAFQRAGEITENIMISMKQQDRPLLVDKWGPVGEALYMFKAPAVNMYNTLSLGAHDIKNAVGPVNKAKAMLAPLTYLSMMGLVGGVHSLPGMEELESSLSAFRSFLAEHFPSLYVASKENALANAVLSPQEAALAAFPASSLYGEILNYGAASSATGLGLTSRFGSGVINAEDPLNAVSPFVKQGVDLAGAALNAVTNPNKATLSNLGREALPYGLRGLYESTNPIYTLGSDEQGNKLMADPKSLTGDVRGDVIRTPREQELLKYGLKSLDETKRRTEMALASKTQRNDRAAVDSAEKSLKNALFRGDGEAITNNAQIIVKLTGDSSKIVQAIDDAAQRQHMSREQYLKSHAKGLIALKAIQQMEEMRK